MQRDPHGEDGGRLRVSLGDIQDGAQDPVHELCEADAAVCVGLHQRFRLAVGRKTGAQFNTLKKPSQKNPHGVQFEKETRINYGFTQVS